MSITEDFQVDNSSDCPIGGGGVVVVAGELAAAAAVGGYYDKD